jgi:hypothetical protein
VACPPTTRWNGRSAGLADLSRKELAERWIRAFRRPPPKGIKRQMLERALAWHLQAKVHGGLSPSTIRVLRTNVPGQESSAVSKDQPGLRRLAESLAPGTRLVREWHGKSHCVDVVEGGFVYEDKTFTSLSAIARAITGTRWSGPRFFAL